MYDSSVPDGLHFHLSSSSLSVPPIHTELPAAAVISNAFSSADFTVASCRPAPRQACSAASHDINHLNRSGDPLIFSAALWPIAC